MVFSSLLFLTLFYPITLVVYHLLPERLKNTWLLLASLAFYTAGNYIYAPLLCAEIIWTWAFGWGIARHREDRLGTGLLVAFLVGSLGALAVFKYAGFLARTAGELTGISLSVPQIALPIGISFYTFQAISYVVDVRRGADAQHNPLAVGLYLALFPQLIAGPIVRYGDIEPQLAHRDVSLDDACDGLGRFAVGLCKKVLIANQVGAFADLLFDKGHLSLTPAPIVWLGVLAYALQIYFDFSGYSDMAIGLGRTFGFKLPENFRDPYCAATATEFWRRWHISLSSWFRDYVYIPLGGSREGDAKTVRNLAIVWALTGLWHGANWSFVLWGLGWGLLIILERFVVRPDDRSRGFRVVWRAVILLATLLLWVLFRAETMSYALEVIGRMISPEAWRAATTNTKWILLWLHDLGPYLVAGIVLAAGVPGAIARRLPSEGRLRDVLDVAGMLALALLTVLSISFVAQGSYNPFLYFQF